MVLVLFLLITYLTPSLAQQKDEAYSLQELFQAYVDDMHYQLYKRWQNVAKPQIDPLKLRVDYGDLVEFAIEDPRVIDLNDDVILGMRRYLDLVVADKIVIKDSAIKGFDPKLFSRTFPNALSLKLIDNKNLDFKALGHGVFQEVVIKGSSIPVLKKEMFYLPYVRDLALVNDNIQALYRHWAKEINRLEVLDLRGNKIKNLQRGWHRGLENLKELIVDKDLEQPIKDQIKKDFSQAGITANVVFV